MLGEALILGSAGIFSPIVGQGIYNRRKEANERLQGLEADLQELDEYSSFKLSTGRKFLDGESSSLFSSKTLEADIDVDVDFNQDNYDSEEDVLEAESDLIDLGQSTLSNMVNEYEPFNSNIDRYNISFHGKGRSLDYSVADTDFSEGLNGEDRELSSAGDVYQETLDEENIDDYWNLT